MSEETDSKFVNTDFSKFEDGLLWLEAKAAAEHNGNRSMVIRWLVRKEMLREQKLAARRAEKAVA